MEFVKRKEMDLFEIGRDYTFHTIDPVPGELVRSEQVWTVSAMDGPLLKLTSKYDKETVLNTASPHFVTALIQSEESPDKPVERSRMDEFTARSEASRHDRAGQYDD
jgi:hypothetical protein